MKPFHSCRAAWRHIRVRPNSERHVVTRSAATFASLKSELLARPPRIYRDSLSSRHLEQLKISLPPLGLSQKTQTGPYCLVSPCNASILPQGHHLAFFNSRHPVESLLPDGTDADHSPGAPFTRRVWAGGSVAFAQGWKSRLLLGDDVWVCREVITDVRLKRALSGVESTVESALCSDDKIFVDIERLHSLDGVANEPCIIERRTLCFMAPKTPGDLKRGLEQPSNTPIRATKSSFLTDGTSSYAHAFTFTPAMLFRFSAVTFNAHKIHIDPQHCREVEGYHNLLVHGPLLLILMFSVFNSHGHQLVSLDYQNLAPVFVDEEIKVCVQQRKNNWAVRIMGPLGDLRVKGTAIVEAEKEDGSNCD